MRRALCSTGIGPAMVVTLGLACRRERDLESARAVPSEQHSCA